VASFIPSARWARTLGMALDRRAWLAVRLVFVAFWLTAGIEGLPKEPAFPSIGPFPLLFAFLFGLLAVRFWVFRQYTRDGRREPWLLPSWWVNPFHTRQPFQFFHLAGVSFLFFGVAAFARQFFIERVSSVLPPELFAAAFGAGILAGIRLTTRAHKDRFVATAESHA